MPVPQLLSTAVAPRLRAGLRTAPAPRARRARLPDVFATPSELRPAVSVSAALAADGKETEFDRSRAQTLRWLEAHVGPLPDAFVVAARDNGGGVHVERQRSAGAIVRVAERHSGSSRTFGVSIETGAVAGLTAWKAIVVLSRTEGRSRLRSVLLAPHRPEPRAAPLWVPGIVHWLARSPGLTDYGWQVRPTPWVIEDEDGVEGLIRLIGDRDRNRPVFATGLFPRETDPRTAPLDPWDLAHRTTGLAHVVVLTGPMTYALTERVGRRYSVFGNAVRTYRPGCALGCRATEHPMALPETVRRWRNGGPHEFAVFLTAEAARSSVIRQRGRGHWLPEPLRRRGGGSSAGGDGPDPFAEALRVPMADGDGVHPVGAGSDEASDDAAEASEGSLSRAS